MHLRHCAAAVKSSLPHAVSDTSLQGDSTCKTPELAESSDFDLFSATSPPIQHSAGSSLVDLSPSPLTPDNIPLVHSPTSQPDDTIYSTLCLTSGLQFFPANAKKAWSKADEAMELMLQAECPAFNRLPAKTMLSNLVNVIQVYFTKSDSPPSNIERKDRSKPACAHDHEIKRLRRELRDLRKSWRRRLHEPPESTLELRVAFHATHRRLRRLKSDSLSVQKSLRRQKLLREFRANPYRFGQRLFKPPNTTKPLFTDDVALQHFVSSYTDNERSSGYGPLPDLPEPPPPSSDFNNSLPAFAEFSACLKRKRNSSSPGPNGIPYLVWKLCPSLQKRLFTIICKVWKSLSIPVSWQQAIVILLHKSGSADNPANFRPIALTNCDGKIFFSLVANRITSYMCRNAYFDGFTQKGFLPGIAGCVEHATLSHEAIRDARLHHRGICFAWLDLRNAFGSIRHMFIQSCLARYHFPHDLCHLIFNYYEGLVAKVFVPDNFLTKPFHYAIGVFQGCVLSPSLFNICFQPLLDAVSTTSKVNGWSYTFCADPSISRDASAFADDLELCSWQPQICQAQIDICDRFLTWSGTMQARPNKCFATAMRQSNLMGQNGAIGYDRFDPDLHIAGGKIQYLGGNDFKYLGRPLNSDASELASRQNLDEKLRALLATLDEVQLPASCRVWLYHHFVVPKLSWAFSTLDLTLTFVKKLQAISLSHLKNWVGLPRCANSAILFVGDRSRPGLRVHNLCTFWKQQQHIKLDLLKNSKDSRCKKVYDIVLARQERWQRRFAPAVEAACASTVVISNLPESNVRRPAEGIRPGLGQAHRSRKQLSKSVRQQVNSHLRAIDVEEQLTKLRSLQVQGRWLEWSGLMNVDLTWQKLIHNWSDSELRFVLQATTNTAPTPLNLRRWGNAAVDPSCHLCGRPASLRHILNACSSALHQGRYTWRHNCVLSTIKRHLMAFWRSPLTQKAISERQKLFSRPLIHFVPAGTVPTSSSPSDMRRPFRFSKGLLLNSNDWEYLFDLESSPLVFPSEVAVTRQRPDIVIFSRSQKVVILIELTVPLEDRVAASHARKEVRYSSLVEECTANGWFTSCFAVEVGCLGYVSPSLLHCLDHLGIPSSTSRKLRNECSRVAMRCSYLLFLRRHINQWSNFSMD